MGCLDHSMRSMELRRLLLLRNMYGITNQCICLFYVHANVNYSNDTAFQLKICDHHNILRVNLHLRLGRKGDNRKDPPK